MDKKIKVIFAIAAVAVVGIMGYSKVSEKLNADPVITGIQAEFVGEVEPGGTLRRSMFDVKGITEGGKLVNINNFSSETTEAANNGSTCEIELESQGYKTTVIADITREPIFQKYIGYPEEESAIVTCYANGDLEFTGKGSITNFKGGFPWSEYEYSHVYIDETLEIDNIDNWFEGNENLVYCDNLPKNLKTMKKAFYGCSSLQKTPNYFHCSDLKIMDYAFSGCKNLTEIDIIPVNVTSVRYAFENCSKMQTPVNLSKTSNLNDVTGLHSGCINLREPTPIPDSVIYMNETYMNCINIKKAVPFPPNTQEAIATYSGDTGLLTGATIPESVLNYSKCYSNCIALNGNLEINSDTPDYSDVLSGATTNGDKLKLSGNCGNLLAIQKGANNKNIILEDPEAAAQQNERLNREKGA